MKKEPTKSVLEESIETLMFSAKRLCTPSYVDIDRATRQEQSDIAKAFGIVFAYINKRTMTEQETFYFGLKYFYEKEHKEEAEKFLNSLTKNKISRLS